MLLPAISPWDAVLPLGALVAWGLYRVSRRRVVKPNEGLEQNAGTRATLRIHEVCLEGTHYRLVVHNDGPAVADGVEVVLHGISPSPRDVSFSGKFPHRVPNSLGLIMGRRVNPRQDEFYHLVQTHIDDDGWTLFEGVAGSRPFYLAHDEKLTLHFRARASNADPVDAWVLVEWIRGNRLGIGFSSGPNVP